MNFFKYLTGIAIYIGLAAAAQAAPKVISTLGIAATAYSFFTVDTNKLKGRTVLQVQTELQQQLDVNATGLTACWVAGDLNTTNINCGNGAMRFGNAELYTYNLETNIPGVPFALDKAVGEAQGTNFITPNGTVLGDSTGRVVRIHFNKRVAQFGMLVDGGVAASPTLNGIQFVVNQQTTPIRTITAGAPQFVGVEDSGGFTDVTIIASGTPRAWIADHFSFVPLSAF